MHAHFIRMLVPILALLLAGGSAHGARMDELYTVEAGAEDLALIGAEPDRAQQQDSRALRRDLMRAGLARLLIRLAGTSEVAAEPAMRKGLIDRAPSLVTRFRFLSRSGPDGPRIRVHFSPEGVRQGLWDAGWPVWGALRPGILVWVARRDGGGLELTGPDASPQVFEALRRAAERRGLPLIMPLMDGTDRRRLGGRDLLMEDWGTIRQASARYDAEAVLLLRLAKEQGEVRAEWVLRDREGSDSFATRGSGPAEAVSEGMQGVLERLARKHALPPGEATTVRAVVDGIASLSGFARVERALDRLVAVKEVTPLGVADDQARFHLAFRGRPQEASRILGLIELLEPVGDGQLSPAGGEGARGEGARAEGGQNAKRALRFTYQP